MVGQLARIGALASGTVHKTLSPHWDKPACAGLIFDGDFKIFRQEATGCAGGKKVLLLLCQGDE